MSGTIFAADDWVLLQNLTQNQILSWARQARDEGVWEEVVPGLDSLALKFDPAGVTISEAQGNAAALLKTTASFTADDVGPIALPICYAPEFGPDQQLVAEHLGIARADVAGWHSAQSYHVAMIGFLPGFAYLRSDSGAVDIPRLDTPRTKVAAGSVGVLGEQCGLYPMEGPGGWPLIGRTAAKLFDPKRAQPALLSAGQRVTFTSVSASEFAKLVAT